MFDVRSSLPLKVPNSVKKSFTKWVSAQRAIIVQSEVNPQMRPGYGGEPMAATLAIVTGVNLTKDIYLLIQPIYDPVKGEISFFEDADGIPNGYGVDLKFVWIASIDDAKGNKSVRSLHFYFVLKKLEEERKDIIDEKKEFDEPIDFKIPKKKGPEMPIVKGPVTPVHVVDDPITLAKPQNDSKEAKKETKPKAKKATSSKASTKKVTKTTKSSTKKGSVKK